MAKKILLNGGIGDFIALDSWLTDRERSDVEEIFWATPQRVAIRELVPYVFPNAVKHEVVWDRVDWGRLGYEREPCISVKSDLHKYFNPSRFVDVVDYCYLTMWSQLIRSRSNKIVREYQGSRFVRQNLADVSRFELPQKYGVIHPYSQDSPYSIRDLTDDGFTLAVERCRYLNLLPVVVNKGDRQMLSIRGVVDLSNQSTLKESLEIVKGASAFFGAASSLSCLASKVLPIQRMFVKGPRSLTHGMWKFYYAPLVSNNFISPSLRGVFCRKLKPSDFGETPRAERQCKD